MQYRQLGTSDLQVSVVGLGGNTFGPPRLSAEESARCIRRAAELGINFIDTAIRYGEGQSEVHVGRAVEGHRHDWIVATKFNLARLEPNESVRERIRRHCDISLQRLRSDYIDLYQIHFKALAVPEEEILSALAELVSEGKVRWIGECNYASWRHSSATQVARQHGWPTFVSCQNHYNLLRRHVEHETLPFCRENGVAFLPYFPLAGGFLTDKYTQGLPAPAGTRGAAGSPVVVASRTARNEAIQTQLKDWANAQGRTLGELAIAWLLSHAEIPSVIAGVSSPEQVDQNARAAEWVLTEAQRVEVDALAAWDGTGHMAEMLVP